MLIRSIDLETTGLSAPEHAPCEVGWTDIAQNAAGEWAIARTGSRFCNPGRKIPPEVSAIHHITDKHVRGAPLWPVVVAETCGHEDIAGADVVAFAAHNTRFERQWITDDVVGPKAYWICTYRCALRIWPDAPSHSNQALRYYLDLQVDYDGLPHRAGFDSYITALLLLELMKHATGRELIAWSREPAILKRITFGQHHGKLWSEVDTGFLQWALKRDFDEDVKFTIENELERRRTVG